MDVKRALSKFTGGGVALSLLTLSAAALFKVAAFAREAFIASRFGLTSFTDAYFAFAQFPLILSAFMFGAFGLAFAPVYADEKRAARHVDWLPGLIVYATLIGLLLTAAMALFTPWLLSLFGIASTTQSAATVVIVSCSFLPVIWLGIWAGVTIADGKNIRAMLVTGLPYLLMTALLIALYLMGKLSPLSLPISFLVGFGIVGLCTLPALISAKTVSYAFRSVAGAWHVQSFRRFLKQLSASSVENLGYSANQLLLVYFVAHTGPGEVSANTCAMRVGMLGFGLLSQPLAQLMQAKLCAARLDAQVVLRQWLPAITAAVTVFAALLCVLRVPIASAVFLHGNFSTSELNQVTEIVPAWAAYFVVVSLNAFVARYLFSGSRGYLYVRRQLFAYAAANLIRLLCWGRLSASAVICCSVLCEACSLLLSLRSCFEVTPGAALKPALAGVQAHKARLRAAIQCRNSLILRAASLNSGPVVRGSSEEA